MKTYLFLILFLVGIFFQNSCTVQNNFIEREIQFNADWKFIRADVAGAEQTGFDDFRFSISPKNKHNITDFKPKPYTQVFSEKFRFVPNLSILDLIFNMGQEGWE